MGTPMGVPMGAVPISAGGVVGDGRRAHGRAHVQPMGGAQVTPSEVAQRTGRSRRTVMRAIQSGRLAARKLNDGWRIEPEDADSWAGAHGQCMGAPMGGAQGSAHGRAEAVELGIAHGRSAQLETERDRERERADQAEARAEQSLARAEVLEATLSTLRTEREAERRSHREHVEDLRGRVEGAERREEAARAALAAIREAAERERRRSLWGRLLRRGGPATT